MGKPGGWRNQRPGPAEKKERGEAVTKEINPETGIYYIKDWGGHCGIGFVGDQRFAQSGEQVIKRTNRQTTKKWRKLNPTE